jgi:histidine phosphotransfer protein HptB
VAWREPVFKRSQRAVSRESRGRSRSLGVSRVARPMQHDGATHMTNPTIDMAVFAELQEAAGAEFVAELVTTFLEEAPAMLAELRGAQAVQSADAFRRAAHSLKSNSNTFGATALGEMARDIELGGLISDTAPLDALDAEYQRVAAALQALTHG